MMPPLLLFAIRVNPADPDLVAGLQGLVADAAAAPAQAQAQPVPSPQQQQPPAPRDRARWAASARSLPPPISSLRWRPALVRTRTSDGRLVLTDRGEGSGASGGRGGLICTRRRERDGQGHLTMSLI